MDNKATPLETLIERAEAFGKTSIKLFKLKTIDKTSEIVSNLASWFVLIILFALFFTILNIGIALWIGEMLGKSYYGFFILSGFYAILAIVIQIFSSRWIRKPLRNSIILLMDNTLNNGNAEN
jgi:hypothetical protein